MGVHVCHKQFFLLVSAALILMCAFPGPAAAAAGLPNTATFGYGARLDIWGEDVYAALELASSMGLDWLAIEVDWARHWPALDQPADFSRLDYALQAARQKQISVMLSLTNAPAWAMTANGPEPGFTNALLQSILNVYADIIQAVELFPGVNTTAGWGTAPNPQAYLTMLQTVRQGCDAAGRGNVLVTSLAPLFSENSAGSMSDRAFLENLYALGAMAYIPIIGIHYPDVMGAPMSDQSERFPLVLRHYEDIRALMLQYQHNRGMIWITSFTWPTTGTADPSDPLILPATPAHQAQWINQAFKLLQAQLFIGTGFFSNLNDETLSPTTPVLFQTNGTIHPASVTISQFSGGSITSTTWTVPQNNRSTMLTSAANTTPAQVMNFLHFEGKPMK